MKNPLRPKFLLVTVGNYAYQQGVIRMLNKFLGPDQNILLYHIVRDNSEAKEINRLCDLTFGHEFDIAIFLNAVAGSPQLNFDSAEKFCEEFVTRHPCGSSPNCLTHFFCHQNNLSRKLEDLAIRGSNLNVQPITALREIVEEVLYRHTNLYLST